MITYIETLSALTKGVCLEIKLSNICVIITVQVGGGGCLTLNWGPKFEQRIDERTLNSVFWVSEKATLLFGCVL